MFNLSNRALLGVLLLGLASCSSHEEPAVETAAADYRPSNLREAVLLGDRSAVEKFLVAGADVNAAETDGTTLLMRAIHGGFPAIAGRLIAAGADVRATNRYGVNALYLAARGSDAASTKALLVAGAPADMSLPEGETALMTAAKTGSAAVVRTLLTGGADWLALSDLTLEMPVIVAPGATGYGSFTVPAPPTNRANVNARESWYGQTALMWAAAEGHADIVRLLLEAGADSKAQSREIDAPESYDEWAQGSLVYPEMPRGRLTALHFAAREGRLDAAQALIDGGADLNAVDAEGANALLYATLNGHLDVAALLLDAGANIDAANQMGDTALHLATLRGSTVTIQFLADRGANLRVKNAKGRTPLDNAMGVPAERIPYNEAAASLLRRLAQQPE